MKIAILCLLLLAVATPLFAAEELSYDRYVTTLREDSKNPPPLKNVATHFLVYPFEIVRWPVNQALVFTEDKHLYEKGQWIYDLIQDTGITIKPSVTHFGADVDFVRMARQKVNYPDLIAQGSIGYAHERLFETGARIGMERIGGTGLRSFQSAKYELRPQEKFFGLGPDTSRGNGTLYKMERTTLESVIGYSQDPSFAGDLKFAYQNVNISDSEDDSASAIGPIFPDQLPPGLDGDKLISVGPEIQFDTRNQEENSTSGSHVRLGAGFFEGVGNSEARFLKTVAEASKFFSLGSSRRVLAAHFYGEYNNEAPGHEVPFHQMARLGGYGTYPRISRTLRAYEHDRFYGEGSSLINLEYRYAVWEYRDWKADTVLFWDEGQVFRDMSDFQLKDFRESYGIGFRISLLNHVVVSMEMAHGDEGTNFYVKSGAPF